MTGTIQRNHEHLVLRVRVGVRMGVRESVQWRVNSNYCAYNLVHDVGGKAMKAA